MDENNNEINQMKLTIRRKLIQAWTISPIMSRWEYSFLRDMIGGIDGTAEWLHDEAIKDYLSESQIEKIKEIWSTYIGERSTEEVRGIVETILSQKGWQKVSGTATQSEHRDQAHTDISS